MSWLEAAAANGNARCMGWISRRWRQRRAAVRAGSRLVLLHLMAPGTVGYVAPGMVGYVAPGTVGYVGVALSPAAGRPSLWSQRRMLRAAELQRQPALHRAPDSLLLLLCCCRAGRLLLPCACTIRRATQWLGPPRITNAHMPEPLRPRCGPRHTPAPWTLPGPPPPARRATSAGPIHAAPPPPTPRTHTTQVSSDVHMLLPVLVAIMVAKWVADAATHSLYHGLLEVK